MNQGIYEELITNLVASKLNQLDKTVYFVSTSVLDKEEAALLLSNHLARSIKHVLNTISGEKQIETQIEIANKVIVFLKEELKLSELTNDLIDIEGRLLKAIISRINTHFEDLNLHLKEITPYTRLVHSELFTGSRSLPTLESELRKEILSSNEIDLLVSFVKFKGVIILERELREFTNRGGRLRVITTTYMGATDYRAVNLLASLENTQVKISYNTGNERLHAKAYLFKRNTGFHTGYIGSSNFSRSALTDGLEWNLKITTKEVGHIINKFQKTFDSYWESDDFELFDDSVHKDKLVSALKEGKSDKKILENVSFFEIKPFPFQLEILEKLEAERTIHKRYRNLIVAATGTGKTVISAFDYKRFRQANKPSKLLFLAHRKEILLQAISVFRSILRDNNFGDFWGDGVEPSNYEFVFASVQTLNNRIANFRIAPDFYDFIIIDECHHMTASSYRSIINYFKPKVLLGLTATPERMDGGDIQEDFYNRISAEIRLPEALNRKLLCPFQYFGISDSVDLTNVGWVKGKYVVSELSEIYTSNINRVGEIIKSIEKYTKDIKDVRALCFCVTMEHAKFMAEQFVKIGVPAEYLTSESDQNRNSVRKRLVKKEINYLFVVDIFNEGVDVPEIDTVIFLRPTESLTIFLQQLGRGLRLADGKDCLTVLDFVGNSRPEYNFENKFRALIGRTTTPVKREIEDNFPHLPLGCSIVLEKMAKEVVLKNISAATSLTKRKLIKRIQQFQHETSLSLTLRNFVTFTGTPLQEIYNRGGWSKLCFEAGKFDYFDTTYERNIVRAIFRKWLACSSASYFNFILEIARKGFNISIGDYSEAQCLMLLMIHYDVWQNAGGFDSLEMSIREIGRNRVLVQEIIEVIEYLLDEVGNIELDVALPYPQPLKVHSRYTREQILVAFGLSTFKHAFPSREGAAENPNLNTELLFINLIKSSEEFSPTTMYDDYAINEHLFHWQSQNSIGPNTLKGKSYVNHLYNDKIILLFIREKKTDEFDNTMAYVFCGQVSLVDHSGSKPMNIIWDLKEPLPSYLWQAAVKVRSV